MINPQGGAGRQDEMEMTDLYSILKYYEVILEEDRVSEECKNIVKVFGVGGAGSNMITLLKRMGVQGAELIAVNTDSRHLDLTHADKKILIGYNITGGRGVGGDPELGEKCAREDIRKIIDAIGDAELVFVAYGLGGGTGTGAGPVIAEAAKEKGAIVIGCVTLPFEGEGKWKMDIALKGLKKLREHADTVAAISNERLNQVAGHLTLIKALEVGTLILALMVKGVTELVTKPALMNIDLADLRALMSRGGMAAVCVGYAEGNNRCLEALRMALKNPLLEVDPTGANGALIVVRGGSDLTLSEIRRVTEQIASKMVGEANLKWGADINKNLEGKVKILVVLTGIKLKTPGTNVTTIGPEEEESKRIEEILPTIEI